MACQDIPIRQSVRGTLPCQEMDGRSRLSVELRFDPSNLSDRHQIGRRFSSLGENSQSKWLREIVSLDVCVLGRAAEGLLLTLAFDGTVELAELFREGAVGQQR